MRQEAQLDLGVVGNEQRPPRTRDESAPDVAAELSPDGDVLQIWIARRESAGGGHSLVIRRVEALVSPIDEIGKRVEIRRLEFRDLAILHEQRGKRVPFVRKILKDARVGSRSGRGP